MAQSVMYVTLAWPVQGTHKRLTGHRVSGLIRRTPGTNTVNSWNRSLDQASQSGNTVLVRHMLAQDSLADAASRPDMIGRGTPCSTAAT
jgi:hypothetical protein